MDISMYGQQSNTYGPPESSYVNYTSDGYSQAHISGDISSQNYGNTYSFEESSYIYTSEAVGSPTSQEINCYQNQTVQNNPIISTDSGLSYTNLDYSNSNSVTSFYSPINHQGFYSQESYQKSQSEILIRHENNAITSHQTHHNYHHNKYVDHPLERDIYPHSHLFSQNVESSSCMEYQNQHKYKEETHQTTELERHNNSRHSVISGIQSPPQPVVPTYKWMQVKRNVPKPSGKEKTTFVCNNFFFSFKRSIN